MEFYRRNLPHLQKDFTPHFITFVTKFRWILPPSARDIVLSCCSHDHRKNYELYVAAGHAGSRTHDLGAASRRESTRNSFLERDYANDQECLCTPDQPAAESPRACLARGVIRSCCGRRRISTLRWITCCATQCARDWSHNGRIIDGLGRDKKGRQLR